VVEQLLSDQFSENDWTEEYQSETVKIFVDEGDNGKEIDVVCIVICCSCVSLWMFVF
jgi:hypothetical protein